MPVITVDYPKGKFSPGQRDALAEAMTQVILQIEGGADTPAGRSIAWVKFNEIVTEVYCANPTSCDMMAQSDVLPEGFRPVDDPRDLLLPDVDQQKADKKGLMNAIKNFMK